MMKRMLSMLLAVFVMTAMLLPAASSADSSTSEVQNVYNVLVLNFDPVFEQAGGLKQSELLDRWNDPHELAEGFISDMSEISHGYANYSVVEWIDIDELPRGVAGSSYTLDYYYETLMTAIEETGGAYWKYEGWEIFDDTFDYEGYLTEYGVFDKVNNGEVDEVWVFAGPMVNMKYYETRMIGRGAYWCNSTPMEYDCKPFVVYGFNYERGVGEMLEDAGHRMESIMRRIMGTPDYTKDYAEYTDWERFTAYEKVAPGKSGVGNIHYAPNSTTDYEWGNETYVYSYCNDWANYPDMTAEPELVNCETWGGGDIRLHHKWWFQNIPHADGVNPETGYSNNWWTYFTLDYLEDMAAEEDTSTYYEDRDPYNVLVLNFDPAFEQAGGARQSTLLSHWNDPHKLAEQFISDMSEVSYGYVNYNIAEWIDIEALPRSTTSASYTLDAYYETLMTANAEMDGDYWNYEGWETYGSFDYVGYLTEYGVFDKVDSGEIDEVWVFTGPMVGVSLSTSKMIGTGAYYCNSAPIEYDCRPFVVMGFNYERKETLMLWNQGMRMESIMQQIMGAPDYSKDYSEYTDWEKFSAYELAAPGNAGVGTIRYAPNSAAAYDYGNYSMVYATCKDWLNYPELSGESALVNCNAWGYGDQYQHHKWWFKRIPHVEGVNAETGYHNNWWVYFTLDYLNRTEEISPVLSGDVNCDGEFSVLDVIALQRYLLAVDQTLADCSAGDFDDNGILNGFDLALMKRSLLTAA